MEIRVTPYLEDKVDDHKEGKKEWKIYRYYVDFQFGNEAKVRGEFSVKFIKTTNDDLVKVVKRRTYWGKIGKIPKLSAQEEIVFNAEIDKLMNPDKGEIQHINSHEGEFNEPNDNSFFGDFINGFSY